MTVFEKFANSQGRPFSNPKLFICGVSKLHKKTTVQPPVSDHPKCQVEVVAYESLDHNGSKFFLVKNMITAET